MSWFSIFSRKEKELSKKSLEILKERSITPDEILSHIKAYHIKDVHDLLDLVMSGTFQFLTYKESIDYINFITNRLDLIQEFEPILLRQKPSVYCYVFNTTIGERSIRESCIFLVTEGIKNPITFLKDYQYEFFDSSKAYERIKEKNEYLKNHPYLIGNKKNTLEFRIKSSYLNSMKTMENELKIYKECDMIDDLLFSIKRFGYISEGEEKLKLFSRYSIPNTERNIFLKKHFKQVLTINCSVFQLEKHFPIGMTNLFIFPLCSPLVSSIPIITLLNSESGGVNKYNYMQNITFITGNPKKAEYLAKYLGFPIDHIKLDLDEIQSLDSREIVTHKVKEAYNKIRGPVLVEDVSLSFSCLGKLPGPFIKFFESELGLDRLAKMVDSNNRNATASCTFGYFDGVNIHFFEGNVPGNIAPYPRGEGGFGWDKIFIPYWTEKTTAELDESEYERFYTEEKPFSEIREFLLRT